MSSSIEVANYEGAPAPARGPRVTLQVLRILVTVHMLAVCVQPVLAGMYLSGDFDALNVHAINASVVTSLSLFQLIGAVVFWLAGRGRGWPAVCALALFVAETLQIGYGYARELYLHIPLGVAIVVGSLPLTVWVWQAAARRARGPIRLPFRRAGS